MSESAFAQHILNSIRNELELLKRHDYIQPHAYNEILNLLPKEATCNKSIPPSSFGGAMPSPAYSNTSSVHNSNSLPPPPSYNEKNLGSAEALYEFTGENPSTDLSFRCGDVIQIVEFVNNDWWKGSLNGKTGIFPSNYVKKLDPLNEKKTPPPPPTRRNDYGNYSPPKQDLYNNYNPPTSNYTSPPNTNYTSPSNNNYYPPASNYASPPPAQTNNYAPPPVQQSTTTPSSTQVTEENHGGGKVASLGKKFAGNVANAATWGFGATIGSDIAHSIF